MNSVDVDAWFCEGARAGENGSASPYDDGSIANHWWTRGYSYKVRLLRALEAEEDTKRLEWLSTDHARLEDVRGHLNNEGGTVREAIDWLTKAQRERNDQP